MFTRDDLAVSNLTFIQKAFQSWHQAAYSQPQVTGIALSIATAGIFASFSISLPDNTAESYSMLFNPYSSDLKLNYGGRKPGVLSIASGTTTVFFTEPQTFLASDALYSFPGEALVGTISANVTNSYFAVLSSNSASTYIQSPFSTNADTKYFISAYLKGQACSSSLASSDSDSSRLPKQLQWQSPAVYELVSAHPFTSSCSTGSHVFPDNSNGAVPNYPTGCNAFNGMFDVFIGMDKSVDAHPHKPYGYISVTAGSLVATFYSTSWHLNSQQTLFDKKTGAFIGTLTSGLINSNVTRQGILLRPSPITLVLAQFVSGEGVGNGYKVNNTVMISKSNIGDAGPSLLLIVTSVTASGAIRAVAVKSPTYRSAGAYFACRVTFSGVYNLIISNNQNDFIEPFSVVVYPNFPCSSTSIMTFLNSITQVAEADSTSFSVKLRDEFGNLLQASSSPLGKFVLIFDVRICKASFPSLAEHIDSFF